MMPKLGGVLVGALLALAACGPMDDGGGGVVGDVCLKPADCVPNGCCGRGTAAVNVSRAPDCSMTTCSPTDPDPTNQTVNNTCGLPYCDASGHCAVATRC